MISLIAIKKRRAGALWPALALTAGLIGLAGCSGDVDPVGSRDASAPESANGGFAQGGSTARFLVKGNNVYTINRQGIISYGLTQGFATVPRRLDSLFVANWDQQLPLTLYPYDSLVLSAALAGVHVMRPRPGDGALQLLSFAPRQEVIIDGRDPVVGQNGFLYATLEPTTGEGSLTVFELENRGTGWPGGTPNLQPRQIARINIAAPRGLAIRGKHLYVCYKDGIAYFDVSNPRAPNLVRTLPMIGARDCLFGPNGQLVVVARSGLFQYSVDEAQGILSPLSRLAFGG